MLVRLGRLDEKQERQVTGGVHTERGRDGVVSGTYKADGSGR